MDRKVLLMVLSLTLCVIASSERNLKLEFVQVLWRHGDRSPVFNYPNDPNQNYWRQGPGMLTQLGMREQYELGSFLKSRYIPGFISENYLRNETYVLSSNVDRAIESASCNLAAFYPPTKWQVWNENIQWQPVPIHTIEEKDDNLLDVPWDKCPLWVQIDQKFQKSDDYVSLEKKYSKLFQKLSDATGIKITLDNAGLLLDNLICDQDHNLTLPDWADAETLQDLSTAGNFRFFGFFRTGTQKKLLGGSLLNLIREIFGNKIAGRPGLSDKYMALSGHDTTIIALTSLLGVFNNLRPPYVSSVLFELYSDANLNYFINVSYHNSSTHGPYPTQLPFCHDLLCPWEDFLKGTSSMVISNWTEACAVNSEKFDIESEPEHRETHVARFLIMASVFVILIFVFFLIVECYCLYIKRRVLDPKKLKLDISIASLSDRDLPNAA